jgi:acetylglutamate kinase
MRALTILKIGGELLEDAADRARMARAVVRSSRDGPLVVVHGGGRSVDAALAAHGIPARSVDGLRITDDATLAVVVSILAGLVNTRLAAAVAAAGGLPVGLTGADAGVGLVEPAPPHRTLTGRTVDLGRVGSPIGTGAPRLVLDLLAGGYVPIMASIGCSIHGDLFNVNADTWAAHLGVELGAARLVIAGGTPGVLDEQGRTIGRLYPEDARDLVERGQASGGMLAKLEACRQAVSGGVPDVRIVDGRSPLPFDRAPGTQILPAPAAAGSAAGVYTGAGDRDVRPGGCP